MDFFQLFALAAFAAFAIPSKTRVPALLFFFMYLIENTYHDKLDGLYYYLFVATQDYLLVMAFLKIKNKRLFLLSATSFTVSFYGWVIYEFYFAPTSYNFLAQLTMALQIAALGIDNGIKDYFGGFRRFMLVYRSFSINQERFSKSEIQAKK